MKKNLVGMLIVVVVLLLAVAPIAVAQDMCVGDFDYDTDCDGTDAAVFKSDYGRGGYNNPCPPDGPAPVPKTGQTTTCATGDDGDLQKGVIWPYPRFTDNLDGTITDNLTGLIWLKNANCFGSRSWNNALSDCNGLSSGYCGLTDGSNAGDWRLPNYKELFSLVDAENYNPALPSGHPFTNVQLYYYWSSTTFAEQTFNVWVVPIYSGGVYNYSKGGGPAHVWPVRGGQ